MKIIVTSLLGMESLIGEEIRALGYPATAVTVRNAMVELDAGDAYAEACARINLWTRCGERVLLQLGERPAPDFDALFDAARALPWEDWIEPGQVIHVDGYTRASELFSVSACQSILKKAIVERIISARGAQSPGRLAENPDKGMVSVRFGILDDVASFMVDTSGAGLHKRGYRPLRNVAPIRETLAAAMVRLSQWNPLSGETLLDPFCGSGTIPIEATLIAGHLAPGAHRSFSGENWAFVGRAVFDRAREEAGDLARPADAVRSRVFGSDLDPRMVTLGQENAQRAGVPDRIGFFQADAFALDRPAMEAHVGSGDRLIVCNPPYGERMLSPEDALAIQDGIAEAYLPGGALREDLRLSVLSPDDLFERNIGVRADKRRKLYNGMIKCTMYHYFKHKRS